MPELTDQQKIVLSAVPRHTVAKTKDIAAAVSLPQTRVYRALRALHKAGCITKTYACCGNNCCGREAGLYPHWYVGRTCRAVTTTNQPRNGEIA